jgi:hypothetical protein
MKKIILISLFLSFGFYYSFAQNYQYKVFYTKGEVSIQQGNTQKSVVKDMLVKSGNKLVMEDEAIVVLLNTANEALVIEQAGTYSIKNIEKLYENINHGSLTQKYFNYVVEELMHHHGEKSYTGAVSRGQQWQMHPLDSCIIIGSSIHFSWVNTTGTDAWFMLYSVNGERLYELKTKETSLIIQLDTTNIRKGENYLWMISTQQYPDKEDVLNVIHMASDEEIAGIKNKLDELNARFIDEEYSWDTETNLLLLYAYFMQTKLFIEAQETKKSIEKQFPGNPLVSE